MAHTAIEFGVTELAADQAVTAALTAADKLPGDAVSLADGTVVSYKRQPTLDELQHAAKQLLPKPTSSEFAQAAKALIGSSLKPNARKGKKAGPSQAAVWAGNLRRLAREIAVLGKATARAAGKRSARTAGKAVSRTGAQVQGELDPVRDLAGTHCNQQAPVIGVEIKPEENRKADANAYYVPANCAVWRKGDNCFANVTGVSDMSELVGISTADGVESSTTRIYPELQHIGVVATGIVSLLCPPARAKLFKPGDMVYCNPAEKVKLQRKPEVEVSNFTTTQTTFRVGRFVEACGPKGGIRVQLSIKNP